MCRGAAGLLNLQCRRPPPHRGVLMSGKKYKKTNLIQFFANFLNYLRLKSRLKLSRFCKYSEHSMAASPVKIIWGGGGVGRYPLEKGKQFLDILEKYDV